VFGVTDNGMLQSAEDGGALVGPEGVGTIGVVPGRLGTGAAGAL